MFHRLLLRVYPRWFRREFDTQLIGHLARQRTEPRYRDVALGTARFWWDAGIDAMVTGVMLRLGRARERWSSLWREQKKVAVGGWPAVVTMDRKEEARGRCWMRSRGMCDTRCAA